MGQGKFVISQLCAYVSRYEFGKCVERYPSKRKHRKLSCWGQFILMMFGQLTHRESIRDIFTCLNAHPSAVYHLGIKQLVSVSSLTRANEQRDWRIYADLAAVLLAQARSVYQQEGDLIEGLENAVYAFDSTTIDLCLKVFFWAHFRRTKAAIKLHTLLDLRGNLPTFIYISDAKKHDIKGLGELIPVLQQEAFYIMDRGYADFGRLSRIHQAKAYFVVRVKNNLAFNRLESRKVDKDTGLRCDQTIKLTGPVTSQKYKGKLRRVKVYDTANKTTLILATNNFEITALQVAQLYKQRWQVELFFRWIKQHLKITKFWGHSINAVKTQIWIAICSFLIVAIARKKLNVELTLYQMLQIISVSPFSKEPLNQLFSTILPQSSSNNDSNQLKIMEL